MGLSGSKSPLERRNTVARRSQRRSIHSIKDKIDKVFPKIKKFRGVNQDEDYHAIRTEIEHIRIELSRKSKDLQPQVRDIHNNTVKKIDEAVKALDNKLNENQEKAQKKEREREEKEEKKKNKNKDEDVTSENNDVEVQEIQEDEGKEADNLEQSTEKRKTVELKFVQIIPDEITQADIHSNNNNVRSPEEKRKSILKHGVAVMPGAMMNEIAARTSASSGHERTEHYIENNSERINAKINDIIENLQAIEYQIADFIGKKHGTQYNRIKDKLNHHMITLNGFSPSDDYTIEQVKICRNYIISCLNFLEEKAIEEESIQDDVFHAKSISPALSPHLSPIDARNKLEKLSKTTAI